MYPSPKRYVATFVRVREPASIILLDDRRRFDCHALANGDLALEFLAVVDAPVQAEVTQNEHDIQV